MVKMDSKKGIQYKNSTRKIIPNEGTFKFLK
jgi:hypothetical protein